MNETNFYQVDNCCNINIDEESDEFKKSEEIINPVRVMNKCKSLKCSYSNGGKNVKMSIKTKHSEIALINDAINSNKSEKIIKHEINLIAKSCKSDANIILLILSSSYSKHKKMYNLMISKINISELLIIEDSFDDCREIIKNTCIKSLTIHIDKITKYQYYHTTNFIKEIYLLKIPKKINYTIKVIRTHYITNSVNIIYISSYDKNETTIVLPNSIKCIHASNNARFPFKLKYFLFSYRVCGIIKKKRLFKIKK
jgi:hypothetical protein